VNSKTVQLALSELGVRPLHLAAAAAADSRIAWSEAALARCKRYVEASAYDNPGADLWLNWLQQGELPPETPPVVAIDEEEPAPVCPVCNNPLPQCTGFMGVHGFPTTRNADGSWTQFIECWYCKGDLRDCLGIHADQPPPEPLIISPVQRVVEEL
jgi:hypothetical protein